MTGCMTVGVGMATTDLGHAMIVSIELYPYMTACISFIMK